jgi:hypothetical protein
MGFGGGAGDWASANEAGSIHDMPRVKTTSIVSWWRARLIRINIFRFPSGFPDGVSEVSAVDNRQCADSSDHNSQERD